MNRPVGSRNRVSVGVYLRMAEGGCHPFDHGIGHGMLQPLRLLMDQIPGGTQKLDQVGFDQTMPANHAEGSAATLSRELNPAIGHVLQEAVLRKPLHHPSN